MFRISVMADIDSYRPSRHSVLRSTELRATSLGDPTPYALAMTSIDSFLICQARFRRVANARGREVAEFSEYKMRP